MLHRQVTGQCCCRQKLRALANLMDELQQRVVRQAEFSGDALRAIVASHGQVDDLDQLFGARLETPVARTREAVTAEKLERAAAVELESARDFPLRESTAAHRQHFFFGQ